MNINDVVIQKVEQLKKSQFGATAIKVELEAQFNRGSDGGVCEDCYEGSNECYDCDGTGEWTCDNCEDGIVEVDEVEQDCQYCDGNGNVTCDSCGGEGRVECGYCEGNWDMQGSDFGSTSNCHNFIMEKLVDLGLAKLADESIELSHSQYSDYEPVLPLTYAEFYNDGSVDSEFTFTLMLDKPENILLLPKVIEVFNQLGEAIGNGVDVAGAGMHMALLNSLNGMYPTSIDAVHAQRFRNFKKSMILLMPALYFLGANSSVSRGLNFRTPGIGEGSHRTAIDFRGGALEYRFFDTCYDNPEQILDNVVVIANTIRHWTTRYTKHGLSKIANGIQFGTDSDRTLKRFYTCYEHIDLLNAGLKRLKPSYRTIRELKKQRDFDTTKLHIKKRVLENTEKAKVSYKEYEDRFKWQTRISYYQSMASEIDNLSYTRGLTEQEKIAQAKARATERTKNRRTSKTKLEDYIKDRLREIEEATRGRWTLREEG